MSRQTYTATSPDDFFSHHALELTFRLLRNNNPGLANAIKKTLDQIPRVPYENLHTSHTGEMHFNAQVVELLNVHVIGRIVSTLTEIGQSALEKQDLPPEHLNMLRNLLDDWAQLTDWILRHNTSDHSASDKVSMH